ncbi:glycosyltransferase [Niveispirillum sp. SYP-B3756]|uniref:glycosyltransferase n=1 Tax=Niveispirillum sp. SYP-B3756 TaxID=2662178 RepID=UPI001290C32E|nr:glycosyltransferase [Niveispirillum sp. SYP-B3756]MQP64367.1 glycosyltransferase [Niveispirillum sp. SYP-B3756]
MKISITSLGSRGDVQPIAAVASALAARGHDVIFVTTPACAGLLQGTGVRLGLLDGDIREELASADGLRLIASGKKPAAAIRAARAICARNIDRWWTGIKRETAGSDLFIGETSSLSAMLSLAEASNRPFLWACMQPLVPTGAFPSPLIAPPQQPLPPWGNRLHHFIIDQMLWQSTRSYVNKARRNIIGLPAWPLSGPIAKVHRERRPTLLAYSEHLVPRPDDWDDNVSVTGYWFLEKPSGWVPPEALTQFLAAGAPPVYIGFGSMTFPDPQSTTRLILSALKSVGCRAIIAAGWGGLVPETPSRDVFVVGEAPHDWLFQHVALAVHHGGAGTTASALRAGIPSVIVPFMADQFFWGARLTSIGVSGPALPYSSLTVDELAHAIRSALADSTMRRAAARIGMLIRSENGIATAVGIIESVAVSSRPLKTPGLA